MCASVRHVSCLMYTQYTPKQVPSARNLTLFLTNKMYFTFDRLDMTIQALCRAYNCTH